MYRSLSSSAIVILLLSSCIDGDDTSINSSSVINQDNSTQAARIANLVSKQITCSALASAQSNLVYNDSDFFDCQLTKSLNQEGASIISVAVPGNVSANLPSKAEQNILLNELPDRLAAWTHLAKDNGNEVTVCVAKRPELWTILVSLGLGLIERFLEDRASSPKPRYKAVSDYNVAVIYDANGSNTATLQKVEFWNKSEGSISSKLSYCSQESSNI